jgi:polar amino acid transport system substrate-binding protein
VSRPGARAVLALPLVLLLAAGCGTAGNGTTAGGASVSTTTAADSTALGAMVPPDVAKDGKLTIGTDATYAPNEFLDNGKPAGMDIDLGNAIAEQLGLTADFQTGAFDTLLPGVSAGKYELAMSSISVNTDRLQAVDLVTYFTAGTAMAVLKGNPADLALDGLCGHTVAVEKDTTQDQDLAARSANCTQSGKLPITVSELPAQPDVVQALTSKQADAMLADSPAVAYAIKQAGGQLEQLGGTFATAPYGIAVGKSKGDLAKAVQGAVQALIEGGMYQQILDKWGISAGAVKTSEINPQTYS